MRRRESDRERNPDVVRAAWEIMRARNDRLAVVVAALTVLLVTAAVLWLAL